MVATGDFVSVDPESYFAVDGSDVIEVPVRGWFAEFTFGEASGAIRREGWEWFEFGFTYGEDITVGGEPSRFFAGALFVLFCVAVVEDLDFDTGVWKSVGYKAFEGFVGGPEKEA